MVLINAVKDVAKALAELISATKCAAGKAADDPSMYQLKSAAKVSHTKGHLHDTASDHVVDVHRLIQQQPNCCEIFHLCTNFRLLLPVVLLAVLEPVYDLN